MTQKLCPICGKRAFDISDLRHEQVEIDLKCPHCKRIVSVRCAPAAGQPRQNIIPSQ